MFRLLRAVALADLLKGVIDTIELEDDVLTQHTEGEGKPAFWGCEQVQYGVD